MNKITKLVFFTFISLGLLIFAAGSFSFYINIHKQDNCTEKVTAVCSNIKKRGHNDTTGGNHKRYYTYSPYFDYEYNGKHYDDEYGISYSTLENVPFKVNQQYTIYVDPKKPYVYIVEGYEEDIDTFALAGPLAGLMESIMFTLVYVVVKARIKSVQTKSPYDIC